MLAFFWFQILYQVKLCEIILFYEVNQNRNSQCLFIRKTICIKPFKNWIKLIKCKIPIYFYKILSLSSWQIGSEPCFLSRSSKLQSHYKIIVYKISPSSWQTGSEAFFLSPEFKIPIPLARLWAIKYCHHPGRLVQRLFS